ncbi:outer membrane protein assembly factor BamD [Thermodesulfatator atlanticus]|uniref:outer membrane protein assembly factor BamD n=1 Tax=Thermodesulfatator atlanticus TaxID=501497 RepID=UPI0003B54BE4|nr:outer membrane protein assembly factor BamD [Thermodesulfatator atlanticus]
MRHLAILFLCLFITACGGGPGKGGLLSWFKKENTVETADEELNQLVKKALHYYQKGLWEQAEEAFRAIRDRYPDTPYALWAELKLADAKFFAGNYEEAIVLYEEFEKLHPTNEAIPYVIYQIGTCYYKLKLPPDRDQSFTKKAIENYERLVKRFPDSPYTLEAQKRIEECRATLGAHELYVAKFYYRTKRYRAAYYRLLYLLETYPETKPAAKARTMVAKYYRKALEETKALAEGTLKDFWGRPYP